MILDDLTKKERGFSDDGFGEDMYMINKLTIDRCNKMIETIN